MQDLDLSGRELGVLRALMAMEPAPGEPLPEPVVLERIHDPGPVRPAGHRLRRHDGAGHGRRPGHVPAGHRNTVVVDLEMHEQHGGPFFLGVMHWRLHPQTGRVVRRLPPTEGGRAVHRFPQRHRPRRPVRVHAGGEALHLARSRRSSTCSVRCSNGLARERPTPLLPATLTITERRILCDVACGFQQRRDSRGLLRDGEHGAQAPREHLPESSGVTNRMAAVARASRERRARARPAGARSRDTPDGEYPTDTRGPIQEGQRKQPHDTLGGHHDAHPSCGDGRLRHRRHGQPGARARASPRRRSPLPTPAVVDVPGPPKAARSSWTGNRSSFDTVYEDRSAQLPRLTDIPKKSVPPCSASSPLAMYHAACRVRRTWAAAGVGRRGPGSPRRTAELLPTFQAVPGLQTGARQVVGRDPPRPRPLQGGPSIGADTARDYLRRSREGDGYLVDEPRPTTSKPLTAPYWQPTPPATDMLGFLARLGPEPGRDRGAASGPYTLGSSAWVDDYEEVRAVGNVAVDLRTPAQAATALFHNTTNARAPSATHDPVLRRAPSGDPRYGAGLRLMHGALADSLICAWQQKRDVGFWRPFQAIAGGDDGNPLTTSEPGWTPLLTIPAVLRLPQRARKRDVDLYRGDPPGVRRGHGARAALADAGHADVRTPVGDRARGVPRPHLGRAALSQGDDGRVHDGAQHGGTCDGGPGLTGV